MVVFIKVFKKISFILSRLLGTFETITRLIWVITSHGSFQIFFWSIFSFHCLCQCTCFFIISSILVAQSLHLHLITSTLRPFMSKVFGEYHILHSKEVCFSHQNTHLLMNKINIVFSFNNSVEVNVDNYIETVIYISSNKCQNQFENFSCDIVLNFADIDPFESCF